MFPQHIKDLAEGVGEIWIHNDDSLQVRNINKAQEPVPEFNRAPQPMWIHIVDIAGTAAATIWFVINLTGFGLWLRIVPQTDGGMPRYKTINSTIGRVGMKEIVVGGVVGAGST